MFSLIALVVVNTLLERARRSFSVLWAMGRARSRTVHAMETGLMNCTVCRAISDAATAAVSMATLSVKDHPA